MTETLYQVLEKYIDFNFGRNPLSYEELQNPILFKGIYKDQNFDENNPEDIFIVFFLEKKKHLDEYREIEPNLNLTYGELLAEYDRSFPKWRKALKTVWKFTINANGIQIHYLDTEYKRSALMNHNMITLEFRKFHKLNENMFTTTIVAPEDVKASKKEIERLLDKYEIKGSIGKFGGKRTSEDKIFIKSLYPYYLFLRDTILLGQTNEYIYQHIGEKLKLSIDQKNRLRQYFSDNPPQKIEL